MLTLAWHFDFHSHKSVRIGHNSDYAGVAKALKEAGVEEIITFAKCHNGFSYYPTKVSTPHPLMKEDVFGGTVKACRAADISPLAYISFGIDGEACRKHPDWSQVFATGPMVSPDWFICVCPFTAYTDELMLPQIDEIIKTYRPDGFFFDTMSALGTCYCECCKRDFKAAHGLEIPREEKDPNWGVYGAFRHKRGMALLERVGKFIQQRLPGARVGFNQIGSAPYPEKMPASITRLTLDPPTHGPQSRSMGFCAVYGQYADRPADVMPTIFNQGWGDWSIATAQRLEKTAAAAWARNVRLYVGDRMHPEGRLDGTATLALRQMKDIRRRMAAEFPSDAALTDDEVLILHSRSTVYGEDMRHFAIDPRARLAPLQGAHRLLGDAGSTLGICAEAFLSARLRGMNLVVLPEIPTLDADTEAVLRLYVENGGRILVVGRVPLVGGKPMNWLGVARSDAPWQDHIYLPAWPSMSHTLPVLVRGPFHRVTLAGAEAIVPAIQPYDLAAGVRMGWGICPPASEPSGNPALTRCRYGRGEVWYLEAPIFSDYATGGNWQQVEWLAGLMEQVLPAPRACLCGSPGNVELICRRAQDTTWAVLVNHGGEEFFGARNWPRVLEAQPPYDVVLKLRDARRPVRVTCNGVDVRFQVRDGVVIVPVVMDSIWKVIKAQWQ